MRHCDSKLHVTGKSEFIGDARLPQGGLHAVVLGSPVAHGRIEHIDTARALEVSGVEAILLFDDIPGDGVIGALVKDEPLLANHEVMYHGQPIALIVAKTCTIALEAASLIKLGIQSKPVVTCPREAFDKGLLLQPLRIYSKGDVDVAWPKCVHIIEGSTDIGGQEHVYLETNRALAVPLEDSRIKVYSSTQSPSSVQQSVAKVLGVAMHQVEIDVRRLGGGFGGKEDQATHWACMAALAAKALDKPVQLILSRADDMRMTGKRHPYKQDYKIGLDAEGKILAYQIEHYQNAGAYMDLSAAVLERSILHSTNAYSIPNVRIQGAVCRTNLPPNTAYRGFGAPQGMFAMEAAIYKAAGRIGVDPDWLQERNLIDGEYTFHYGQSLVNSQVKSTWKKAKEVFELDDVKKRVANYNAEHSGKKKGVALMPVCFGISFTRTFLNQGSGLVHVYTDGSVALTSGGVEMGQGISSNLISIAAQTLGIRSDRIRCNSVNTSRVSSVSPSAASSTTDLNGGAIIVACEKILSGLRGVAARLLSVASETISIVNERVHCNGKLTDLEWGELVLESYRSRVALMAHGFYATPEIHFDNEAGKGSPFHYYSFGTCLIEATVDCLRGSYTIDSAKLIHDLGRSVVPVVDLGQIEGGLAQGIGWVALEDLIHDRDGKLASNDLSTYKIPDNDYLPEVIDIRFIETENRRSGPLGSKAVGEPPFMYGIGAYFAVRQAVAAFQEQQYGRAIVDKVTVSPVTPERILFSLYPNHRKIT